MKKGFLDGYKTYDTSEGFGSSRQWKKAFSSRMTGEEAAEIIDSQADTPYFILGITESATQAEIKAAFRTLIMQWHPDRNPEIKELAEEMSKKIIAAYTILKK